MTAALLPLVAHPYNRGWFLSVIVLVRSFQSAVCRHAPAAHPDAGPRAVLRAAGHALQRIPPDQGAHRARPPCRPGDVSGRRRRRTAEPADHSIGASAGNRGVRIGPSWTKVVLDAFLAVTAASAGAPGEVRRHSFARGSGPARRLAVAQAAAFRTSTTCTRACRSSSPTSSSPAASGCGGCSSAWSTRRCSVRTSSSPSARISSITCTRWAPAIVPCSSRT